jgi:hypothetical protein
VARRVKVRGAKRMRQNGRKRVEVWLDTNELSLIGGAAIAAGMKLATYIRDRAFRAAGAEEQANRRRGD